MLTCTSASRLPVCRALVEIQPVGCLVDSSIDASSSDSSDEDAAAGSSSRRGRPPAGRAVHGSMPGWIGRLEERQLQVRLRDGGGWPCEPGATGCDAEASAAAGAVLLQCRQLSSRGRLCRAQVTLARESTAVTAGAAGTAEAAAQPQQESPSECAASASGTGQPEEQPGVQEGGASAVAPAPWQQALGEALLGALRHAELAPAGVASLKVYCPGQQAVQAGLQLRAALAGMLGEGVQAAVVPVAAAGGDEGLGAALLVELLAVRNPGRQG
jgi:hypothetical protein